jgi:hypothetical protein
MERNQFSKVLKFISTRTKSFTDEVKIEMVNQKTFCHSHATWDFQKINFLNK